MRALYVLCLFWAFQVNASFTLYVVDGNGEPVADAVLSFASQDAAIADTQNPVQNPSQNSEIAVMDQIGMQFEPHVLIVAKDQFVSFPNSDDTRHHVYSFSEPKVFELKLYKGTHSEPVIMQTPGIVELGCNIHDQMIGFIYVDNTGTAIKTDSNGQVAFETAPPTSIMVWHPRLNQAKGTIAQYSLAQADSQGKLTLVIDLKAPQPEVSETGFKSRFKRRPSGTEQ
jgi:plastocyanin